MADLRETARKIVEPLIAQYGAPHDIRRVTEGDFPHLDFARYREAESVLLAAGYKHLADIEYRDVSETEGSIIHPTLVREFISATNDTVASIYLVKPRLRALARLLWEGFRNMRWISAPSFVIGQLRQRVILDFDTESKDGRFYMTSNADAAAMMTAPQTIECLYLAYGTQFSDMVGAHNTRISSLVEENRFVPIRSIDDSMQMLARQKLQRNAHRAAVKWITIQELSQMGECPADYNHALFKEIQNVIAEIHGRKPGQ